MTLPKSAISLTGPESATALDPMTVTGRLTLADGAAPGVQRLDVTRILPDDSRTALSATTAADGTFTITDTPPVSGEIRYEVSWARTPNYQGSDASLTVPVAGRARRSPSPARRPARTASACSSPARWASTARCPQIPSRSELPGPSGTTAWTG